MASPLKKSLETKGSALYSSANSCTKQQAPTNFKMSMLITRRYLHLRANGKECQLWPGLCEGRK